MAPLRAVDVLRPFADVRGINVPIRTGAEASYALSDFQIRLHSCAESRQPPPELADEHLQGAMTRWSAATVAALSRTLADVPVDVPGIIALAREEGERETKIQRAKKKNTAPSKHTHTTALSRPVQFSFLRVFFSSSVGCTARLSVLVPMVRRHRPRRIITLKRICSHLQTPRA